MKGLYRCFKERKFCPECFVCVYPVFQQHNIYKSPAFGKRYKGEVDHKGVESHCVQPGLFRNRGCYLE